VNLYFTLDYTGLSKEEKIQIFIRRKSWVNVVTKARKATFETSKGETKAKVVVAAVVVVVAIKEKLGENKCCRTVFVNIFSFVNKYVLVYLLFLLL